MRRPLANHGVDLSTIWILAQKELRDALRNRWFLLYTLIFLALALGFSYLALAGAGMVGLAGYGRTAASLINLVLLIVPLMGLTVGAQSVAGEREQKTLTYLLAQPITRAELFCGKFVGLALSLLASLTLGFGLAGLLMASTGTGGRPMAFVTLVVLAYVLALVMLSVGLLLSTFARRVGVATGVALFLWLIFVFVGDLGIMGTSIAFRMPVNGLFWLSLANPLQVFKMAAILNIESTLDILGPAGIYGMRQYGELLPVLLLAILGLWALMPAGAAFARFVGSGDV